MTVRTETITTAALIPPIAPPDRLERGPAGDRKSSLLLEISVVLIAFVAGSSTSNHKCG